MDLGPHASFIISAYGFAVLVVAVMVAWVVIDHRQLTRRLAELDARGVTRRSERSANIPGESISRS